MIKDRLGRTRGTRGVYVVALASIIVFLVWKAFPDKETETGRRMRLASEAMDQAVSQIRECRLSRGLALDLRADPNGTGLIGLERSPLTTSLGQLEAKRTTVNPNLAGLLVYLLDRAGAKEGETVAVGASGSFPALVIAAVCAARVLGLEPLVISSLGSSEWGANDPRFHWLDMEDCLRAAGFWPAPPLAYSIGGDEDRGRDMSPEGLSLARAAIRGKGARLVEESGLLANVEARLRLYETAAGTKRIAAFINIGGNWANLGIDPAILKLGPGLARRVPGPAPGEGGVIQAMAARGIPVIHLLHIRGLVERFGLPWDPVPLPQAGRGDLYGRAAGHGKLVLAVGFYAVLLLLAGVFIRRRPARKIRRSGF